MDLGDLGDGCARGGAGVLIEYERMQKFIFSLYTGPAREILGPVPSSHGPLEC